MLLSDDTREGSIAAAEFCESRRRGLPTGHDTSPFPHSNLEPIMAMLSKTFFANSVIVAALAALVVIVALAYLIS